MKNQTILETYLSELSNIKEFKNKPEDFEEIKDHIIELYEEKIEKGLSAERAMQETINEFGNVSELSKQYRNAHFYCFIKRIKHKRLLITAAFLFCISSFTVSLYSKNIAFQQAQQFYQAPEGKINISETINLDKKTAKKFIREYDSVKRRFGNRLSGIQYLDETLSMICVDNPTRSIRGTDGVWRDSMLCADGIWRTNDDVYSLKFDVSELQSREKVSETAELNLNLKNKRFQYEITAEEGEIHFHQNIDLNTDDPLTFVYTVPTGKEYDVISIVLKDMDSDDIFSQQIPLHFRI